MVTIQQAHQWHADRAASKATERSELAALRGQVVELSAERSADRKRIRALEEMVGTPDEFGGLIMKALGGALAEMQHEIRQEFDARIIAALEDNLVLQVKGTWDEAIPYRPGHGVIHNGSTWLCIRATEPGERPGKSLGWRLAVKGDPPSQKLVAA
jgi:hypothetical protein